MTTVAPKGKQVVDTFYRRLFNDYPALKPLFQEVHLPTQMQNLLASLKLVVENLRKPDVLTSALESMGSRHVNYGARSDHDPAVGATLLASLADVAGDAWNNDLEQALSEAFRVVSQTVLEGALIHSDVKAIKRRRTVNFVRGEAELMGLLPLLIRAKYASANNKSVSSPIIHGRRTSLPF